MSHLGIVEPSDENAKRRVHLSPKFFAAIMCLIMCTGIYLIVGALRTREQSTPLSGGVSTTGTIVGLHVDHSGKEPVYAPVVSFTTATGRRIAFTAPMGTNQPLLGSVVRVSYSPQAPNEAHDLSDRGSWHWPLYTGFFIIAFSLLMLSLVAHPAIRMRRTLRPAVWMARSVLFGK